MKAPLKIRELCATIREWFTGDDMPAAERAIWAQARTLQDIADLTARWLSGDLASQPRYWGPVDVDEDDAPGMTETLIAVNRAGFLTDQSQAGHEGPGYDGAGWQQRAAVSGFCDDAMLAVLQRVAADAGVRVAFDGLGAPVTLRAARNYTMFGIRVPVSDLFDDHVGYGVCADSAVREVVAAHYVVVFDPEFGRNDRLWPALRRAVMERGVR